MAVYSLKNQTYSRSLLVGNSSYTPPPPAGYAPIATYYVPAGGAAPITFSSIPTYYTHLQIRASLRSTTSGVDDLAYLRFNGDSTSNYNAHWYRGDGASIFADKVVPWDVITVGSIPSGGGTANIFAGAIIDILDYQNTNKYKTVRYITGSDRDNAGQLWVGSGSWKSTAAITSLSFYSSATFAQYSKFTLYGITGA